jgi:regulator of replication initiation timing
MMDTYHASYNHTKGETSNFRTSTPIRPGATVTKSSTRLNGNPHYHRGNTNSNNYVSPNYYQQPHQQPTPTFTVDELMSQVEELQMKLSELALENEELQYELNQAREENEKLQQTVQSNEAIQNQMRLQLDTVTKMAYTLYERFTEFKCKYHKEKLTGPVKGSS